MSAAATPSALAEVMFAILESVDEANVQAYQSLSREPLVEQAVQAVRAGDPDAFRFALSRHLDEFVDGLLLVEAPENAEVRFLFKHAGFVECHLRERIEQTDGFSCCADKSMWLMRRLAGFFMTGAPIEFDRMQKYTFHLPVQVLNSHDDVLAFFTALRELYYGRSAAFVALTPAIAGPRTA